MAAIVSKFGFLLGQQVVHGAHEDRLSFTNTTLSKLSNDLIPLALDLLSIHTEVVSANCRQVVDHFLDQRYILGGDISVGVGKGVLSRHSFSITSPSPRCRSFGSHGL